VHRGLRAGQQVRIAEDSLLGILVRPEIAQQQLTSETPATPEGGIKQSGDSGSDTPPVIGGKTGETKVPAPPPAPKRFHGSVSLDAMRVGRDAGRIADEVVAHLSGLVGSTVKVTLEIEAEIPSGTPEHVVRTVTENCRTLKFTTHGFEKE